MIIWFLSLLFKHNISSYAEKNKIDINITQRSIRRGQPIIPPVIENFEKSPLSGKAGHTPIRRAKLGGKVLGFFGDFSGKFQGFSGNFEGFSGLIMIKNWI